MKYRPLGRTGLDVSELGFGAWAIGGTGYGATDDRESLAALNFAFSEGINFFDTADVYGDGHSESLIGSCFSESSKRLQVILASKVGWNFYKREDLRAALGAEFPRSVQEKDFSEKYVRFACTQSLQRLRTDYLDLYQLHNPDVREVESGRIFETLEKLKREGKIRFYGISIHRMEEGEAAIRVSRNLSAIQAVHNLMDQRIAHSTLHDLMKAEQVGWIAREPLHCGILTGKYGPSSRFLEGDHRSRWSAEKFNLAIQRLQVIRGILDERRVPLKQAAIEFVLDDDTVSTVIPGMKTEQHVRDHLRAVAKPELRPEEVSLIKATYQSNPIFKSNG